MIDPPDRQSRPLLSLRGIGLRFAASEILRSIDLTVDEGEFVCVVGPSGCGKTTLPQTALDEAPAYIRANPDSARASPAKYTTLPPKVIASLKWPNLSTHLLPDTSLRFWNELAVRQHLINAPVDLKSFVIPYTAQ